MGPLIGGIVGGIVGSSGKKSSSTTVNNTTQQNPYQDAWIHDRFGEGQAQLDELTQFMNERKAALATPQYYNVGGGQSVRQDQFGEYITNQIGKQTGDFNRQLAEYQSGVDRSIGQLGQQGAAARDELKSTYDARLADVTSAAGVRDHRLDILQQAGGQRDARLADITSAAGANESAIKAQQEALAMQGERARAAQEQNSMVAGVKANIKPKNKFRYGAGGSFNRAGLRISSLNI